MTALESRSGNPVSAQRRLRAAVRGHREQARRTQAEVAAALEWSTSKILRIEGGATGIGVTDLKALLGVLGVTDSTVVEELVVLARDARGTGWWRQYRQHVGRHRADLLAHEAGCVRLREWADTHIPDLLQTAGYAHGRHADRDPENLRLAKEIRIRRQHLITDSHGPHMTFLIDESALWRGPSDILDRQLTALTETVTQPHITLHIVPLDSGAPVGMVGGPFTIFDIADTDDTRIGFVTDPLGNPHTRPDPQDVAGYIGIFDLIKTKATDPARTIDYLQHVRRHLVRGDGRYVAMSD